MAKKLTVGTRVRVKDTLLYNGRVGVLTENSGHDDDLWDFNCVLEPTEVPEGTSKIMAKIYDERIIGVHDFQVEAV